MITLHHTVLDDLQVADIKRNKPEQVACTPSEFGQYLQLKKILDKSFHLDLQMAFVVLGDAAMIAHFQQFLA